MNHVWQQSVGVMDGIGVLCLEHPDGRSVIHYFDAHLYTEVVRHNWSPSGSYVGTRKGIERIYLHWLAFGKSAGHGKTLHVDHKDKNTFDSRVENLREASCRSNHHNRVGQSDEWISITKTDWGSYSVRVRFGKGRPYCPGFKNPAQAKACRDSYLELASRFDSGEVDMPTREELKAIAERIKSQTT